MGANVSGFGQQNFFGVDGNNQQLRGGEHLLRALLQAKGEELIRELNGTTNPGQLRELGDSFGRASGLSTSQLAALLRNGGIPGALNMSRPDMASSKSGLQYARGRSFDFGSASSPLGRFLRDNPFERQQLEMALGGRLVPSDADGRLSIMPFSAGTFPGGGRENTAAFNAQSMLSDLSRAANGQVSPLGANVFQGMLLNALSNMTGNNAPQGGTQAQGFSSLRSQGAPNPFVDWAQDSPNQARRRSMFGMGGANASQGGMSAQGMTGTDRSGGAESSSRCASGACGSGGDDIGSVLNDSGLTVEDKITLMIMMIMKKMDQDIEQQANYINSLQQQQQAGGKGGGGKGGGGGGAPSIDVETMKLKRLIDKRSQMFDMLRQIIDKYNQTAKGIIDSMGR